MGDKRSSRSLAFSAKYDSHCRYCGRPIFRGDSIVMQDGRPEHSGCRNTGDPEDPPDPRDWGLGEDW